MENDLKALATQIRSQFGIDNGSTPDSVHRHVANVVSHALPQSNVDIIAQQMVTYVGLNHLLPECYMKFQPLVTESMVFLLQQLPLDRMTRKIVDQVMLEPDVSPGQRLCILINDMPSLQKLGQIICRAPGLAPEFKQALVNLEDNVDTISYTDIITTINKEIHASDERYAVEIEDKILAEASVCVVVAADIRNKANQRTRKSVLKVLKPHVRVNLPHELKMLNRLARFLDENKSKWGLGDFKFKDTLRQIQWLLENEVNLIQEQGNLKTAGRYFHANEALTVPDWLPCSTPAMTAMTRLDGRKITDVRNLDARQRRQLATALFETCIVRPVKDLGDKTIFHGDPHAGNIAYRFEESQPRIIFYDWGMMGSLNRLERFSLALMMMGVMAKSSAAVLLAADFVSGGAVFENCGVSADLRDAVDHILAKRVRRTENVLSDIISLIGECSYRGIIFPTNLLMFQKALITLNGVLTDIDPTFGEDQLVWITLRSHLRDLFLPGYHWKILKEVWALGWYSASRPLSLQHLIIKLAVKLGIAGLNGPWGGRRHALPEPSTVRT